MDKEKGLMLFGVRIEAPPLDEEEEAEVMRKSYSMGNLASCAAANQAADQGYLSDSGLIHNSKRRCGQERKRGVPWTEEEHRTFLAGLEKLGKGDWRGISKNFVTTRTPTQVASHAQKYFLRQSNTNRKKRRSSLFDVGFNDNVAATASEATTELSLKKVEEIDNPLKDNQQVNAPSLIASQISQMTSAMTANSICNQKIPSVNHMDKSSMDYMNTNLFSKPTTFAAGPSFLQLSQPNRPTQQNPPSASLESSDLELSIAPPRPHPLAGAIRVT